MCAICGCGEGEVNIAVHDHGHQHKGHHHDHDLAFISDPTRSYARVVKVEQDILTLNNTLAVDNRRHFEQHGVFAVNLVSSPGSGKTTLLCETIMALPGLMNTAVIEGDQQTSRDAERIRGTGVPTVQINTGKGCHLDAHMISHAIERLGLMDDTLLFVENVGNLVCPAAFDLGEAHKVAILSVTEGEDKPLKYPDMFHAADVMLLNKIDLLPYVNFDIDRCIEYARRVNPDIQVFKVSATQGEGIGAWIGWLQWGLQNAIEHKPSTAADRIRDDNELKTDIAGAAGASASGGEKL
jgi:hydrogenase nickel incorporation protein HypB